MKAALLERLLAVRKSGVPAALVTELASGRQALVAGGGTEGEFSLDPAAAAAVTRALADDRSVTLGEGDARLLIQVFNPPLRLVIVGAVHIAETLIPIAEAVGFAVSVVDPRTGFADRPAFRGRAVIVAWPDEGLRRLAPDARTAVVVLAHDPKLDEPALAAALRSPAFYVGALGSKKNQAARHERLAAAGFGPADLARIHGPIGLAIGARTPAEIAVAIIAEIVARRRLGGPDTALAK
jgi:xanthine dehydrogenase accessory factor